MSNIFIYIMNIYELALYLIRQPVVQFCMYILIQMSQVVVKIIRILELKKTFIIISQKKYKKMIKIKTQTNPKLLKNFSNEAFPDITIITTTSRYNLTLAYLSIDSQYFNQLDQDVIEVDLSDLPEKPLVQILRALYGDQLIAYSISELEALYKVIEVLRIDEYKDAIINQIKNNKDLMENLEILEFCMKNNLMINEIKKIHIDNNLRALQSNRNFLQLNKISLETLIPLLLEYYQVVEEAGASVINNILENYFNRNNIRPVDFFEQQEDLDILLSIWEKFHHILHIQRKPTIPKASHIFEQLQDNPLHQTIRRNNLMEGISMRTPQQTAKIKQKDARIAELIYQIEIQNKTIDKLKKQLVSLKNESGIRSAKRMPSNPILPLDDDDEISLLQLKNPNPKKDLVLKNIKSDFTHEPAKLQTKTPNRFTSSQRPKMDF